MVGGTRKLVCLQRPSAKHQLSQELGPICFPRRLNEVLPIIDYLLTTGSRKLLKPFLTNPQ